MSGITVLNLGIFASVHINSGIGIFGGGYTGSPSNTTDKYLFSGDVVSAGTVLGTPKYLLAAVFC